MNRFYIAESEDLPQPLLDVITNAVPSRNKRSAESAIREIRFFDEINFVDTGYFELTPELKKICSMWLFLRMRIMM